MGNNNSSSVVDRPLYNPNDYIQQGSLNDIRYGNIKQVKSKVSSQICAEITKTLNDEKQWQARVRELKFRLQLEHPSLVKLINFNSQQNNEFCSSFYKLGLLYEYFNNDLKNEIADRKRVNIQYKESELLYLFYSLASVVSYLKSRSAVHGDIRPYNVLVDNSNGQVKLGEIYIQQQNMTNYAQLVGGMTEDCYISPQLLQNLKMRSQNPAHEPGKSEVFSIGATILEAATLESVSLTCYDREYYQINWNQVNNLLGRVRQSYSSNFHSLLQKTLLENEEQRPSVESLLSELEAPWAKSTRGDNITIVEILNSQPQPQQQQQPSPKQSFENPPAQVQPQQVVYQTYEPPVQDYSQYTRVEQPTYTTTTYVDQQTTNYKNSDLDARIEAILRMSKETVEKYSTSNQQYTTTTYVVPETTTYTTNNTYTTSYVVPEQTRVVEDEVKRSFNRPTFTQSYVPQTYTTTSYVQDYTPVVVEDEVKRSFKPATTTQVTYSQPEVTYTSSYVPTTSYVPQSTEGYYSSSYTVQQPQTVVENVQVNSYPAEEIVKRSGHYVSSNYNPTTVYSTGSYAPLGNTFSATEEVVKRSGRTVESVGGNVYGQTTTYVSNNGGEYVTQQYQGSGQALTKEDRDAYVQRILEEHRRQLAQSGGAFQQADEVQKWM